MNIEQFVTWCLEYERWPPAFADLPDVIEISDPILESMMGAFKASAQKDLKVGFPLNYHDKGGRLLGGGWQEGKPHSIAIKPQFLGHGISPVGSFHTISLLRGHLQALQIPPLWLTFLRWRSREMSKHSVMSGMLEQPVFYLLIATQEFHEAHRELRKTFSKVELEQSSEVMTMVEHEKLVKQQHTDIKSAMVRGFWCKFQKRSARGPERPREKGVTRLPNRA